MMHMLGVALVSLTGQASAAETAVIDGHGRVTALYCGGDVLDLDVDFRIPQVGWKRLPGLADAREVKASIEGGVRKWTGKIDVEPGKTCDFEETIREANGGLTIDFRVTPEVDVATQGVYFFVGVQRSVFARGRAELAAGNQAVGSAEMPEEQPKPRQFLRGQGDHLTLTDAGGRMTLAMTVDRPVAMTVEDTREWQGTTYSAFFPLATGSLKAGQVVAAQIGLALTGQPDTSPAHLKLDAAQVRYHLDGFGGDYCFGVDSPVTQYTLDNLNIAWARTEMKCHLWEPENDNDSPTDTNWAYLTSHDKPDSPLHHDFLVAQQLQKRGVPYVISIWHLPDWLYAPPGKESKKVAPDKWPEVLECIGSYLEYAKKQYGVEPDLFCFNEANWGVYTLLTPEEHRDTIKLIGADFARRGLKTKMVLGDTTGPRGTVAYCAPTAADPEALRYVGAVDFHSWGGATPEEYSAWGDLAERLKLPLLVAELGVDAGAWQTAAYDSFHYAVREVEMYQQILLHARPQGTMQWEFTSDYGIVKEQKDAAGQVTLVPTVRFYFVKHFCNLTPHHADALGTSSDHPKVLFTAFRAQGIYTLHLANLGAEREATVEGLPAALKSLRVVRTSETDHFAELAGVKPERGVVRLRLPAMSLTTLTTMPNGG